MTEVRDDYVHEIRGGAVPACGGCGEAADECGCHVPAALRAALSKLVRCYDAAVLIELADHSEALIQMAAEDAGRDHHLQADLRARGDRIRSLRPLMSPPRRRKVG